MIEFNAYTLFSQGLKEQGQQFFVFLLLSNPIQRLKLQMNFVY